MKWGCGSIVKGLWRTWTRTIVRFNGGRINRACYVVEGNGDLVINKRLQSKRRLWWFIPPLTRLCPSALVVDPDSSSIFGFVLPKKENRTLLHCFSCRICHLESKKRKERTKCLNMVIQSFWEAIPQRWMKRRNVAKRCCINFSDKCVNIMTWGVLMQCIEPCTAFYFDIVLFFTCVFVSFSRNFFP